MIASVNGQLALAPIRPPHAYNFQSSILAVMLGWLMLNEGFNPIPLLAAGVVVGGVILSQCR